MDWAALLMTISTSGLPWRYYELLLCPAINGEWVEGLSYSQQLLFYCTVRGYRHDDWSRLVDLDWSKCRKSIHVASWQWTPFFFPRHWVTSKDHTCEKIVESTIEPPNAKLYFLLWQMVGFLTVGQNCQNLRVKKVNFERSTCTYIQHSKCFSAYRIVENFRLVQNFAFFADRLAAAKIRTAKFWIGSVRTPHYGTARARWRKN